jgi:hypothetical protein
VPLVGHMNDTKWDEIRLAMYGLGASHPKWRTRNWVSGYVSDWDGEWFYHFRSGGYEFIEWLEITTADSDQRDAVRNALRAIHVPGEEIPGGFRIYGFTDPGTPVDYV